jgi:tRNA modification GTPase
VEKKGISMEDTIAAIATCVGESAINIIKVSGSKSLIIVNSIFKGKDLTKVNGNTINYGFIMDKNEMVDEVLVSIFRNPNSSTGEDVVEINSHGGVTSTNKILELILNNGARLAEPGEFLKRAFLNGKTDLIKAESTSDLIKAETESARKMSIKGISGELSKLINNLRKEILSLIANIEVNIDYPEYEDALVVTKKMLKEKTRDIKKKLSDILKESENGVIIKNGIKVAIIGKPNVGKSSLLNALINEDKAIVTDVEGTTRDIVEGKILLNGIEVKFVDTAGIRDTEDIVEKIGVQKSIKALDESDLILVIFDNNSKLTEEDKKVLEYAKNKRSIIVINKIDLESKIEKEALNNFDVINISVKNNEGIEELKSKIIELFSLNKINTGNYTYLSNARHISIIKECLKIIESIEKSISSDDEVDLIEIDIKALWEKLGEITGDSYKEDLLDEIFSKFCLGK